MYISLQTSMALTQLSENTLRRRVADGALKFSVNTLTIELESLKPLIRIPLDPDDTDLIGLADKGDPSAQTYLGLLFLENDIPSGCIHWLNLASEKEFPDAMQLLGDCYLRGVGVTKDENMAIMWIAKAASLGHVIAKAQMKGLGSRS